MSEKPKDYNSEMFKQDLKVYNAAIKNKDFKSANILSNRIMSNSWIFDNEFHGIIGFFLRQQALDALSVSNVNNESGIKSVLDATSSFTDEVLGQVSSGKNSIKEIWVGYYVIKEKSRRELLGQDEKDNYETNLDFTSEVFKKVIPIFFNNKGDLRSPANNLVKGILNELNCTSRTYGIKQNDLYILSLLTMLDRIDEYVGATALSEEDFQTRVEKEVIPLVEKLSEVIQSGPDESLTNKFLFEMIKSWRLYFVRFLERARPAVSEGKKPVLDEKIKEEIVEDLAEGIQKEVISE